jgi:hypothetical protein
VISIRDSANEYGDEGDDEVETAAKYRAEQQQTVSKASTWEDRQLWDSLRLSKKVATTTT